MRWWILGTVWAAGYGCAKGAPPAEEAQTEGKPEAVAEPPEKESAGSVVPAMPTSLTCTEGAECLPEDAFARATCADRFPGLALKMFEQGSPWKRMYVTGERLAPVNTRGGATSDPLEPGEEVLLLRRHSSGEEMTVSGSDVDILRWDGTCATLPVEHLTEKSETSVKNAIISWRYLDDEIAQALLADDNVKARYEAQRTPCKSSSGAKRSDDCQALTLALGAAIVKAVRGGLKLPEPGRLPEWNIQEEL